MFFMVFINYFLYFSNIHKHPSSITSNPLPATTKNGRVAGLVVIHFHYTDFTPKFLTSNPLSQIMTSNPRLQPDTHFAVDMFPYKKTELFRQSGFKSKPPKKPGNTPLSGLYLSFLDIKTTVSTCFVCGNRSTGQNLAARQPRRVKAATSWARVSGSQLT